MIPWSACQSRLDALSLDVLCRRLGGKVFTADSTKPPPRWPKVFAVCPASLSRESEAALIAADASFRLVHPSCRVTTYWMDMCVKVGDDMAAQYVPWLVSASTHQCCCIMSHALDSKQFSTADRPGQMADMPVSVLKGVDIMFVTACCVCSNLSCCA